MPADANSLCEYYITSNLKKSNSFKTTTTLTTSSLNNNETAHSTVLNNAQQSESSVSIDFVKYEKNPMDYLKSKYQLLNSNQKPQQEVTTNGHHLNGNAHLPTQNGTASSLQTTNTTNGTNSKQNNASSSTSTHSLLEINWSKIRKIGIGLLNLGNNCYLNATLQCLAYTPPFSQWLLSKPHSPTCKFKQIKGFCSLCEVERLIGDIFNSANGCAKPNTLCFNIRKISNVFSVGTQEDASEFFTTLLESMAKSIKFALNSPSASALNPLLIGASLNQNNNQSNSNSTKRVTTILDDIFSFQFRSRITCSNCGRLSDTIENTNTWPIDVKFVNNVQKGMQHFLREEVLDGENAYKCDKCNKKTRATKKYSIRTAPNILVVHLKRFDYSYVGKLSHLVSYPETLNLKALSPPEASLLTNAASSQAHKEPQLRNTNYKLYGVLVHLGYTSHSGHYYSYVRAPNDVWYKADDERVSVVSKNDALNQNAYILFYSRIINENTSGNESNPTPSTTTTTTNGTHSITQTNLPLISNGNSTMNGSQHFNPNISKLNIPHVIKTETESTQKKACSNYLNSLNTTSLSNSQKIVFKIKSSISQTLSSQRATPYSLVNNRPSSTTGSTILSNGKVVSSTTNGTSNGAAASGALSNGTVLLKPQNGFHSLSSSSTSSLSSSTSSLIKCSTSQSEPKSRSESTLLLNGNGHHHHLETNKSEKSKKSTDSSEKKKKKKKKFKKLKGKLLKGKYSKSIQKKIKSLKNKRDRRKLKKLAKKLGLVEKKKDSKHNHHYHNQHEQSSYSNSP